MTGNIVSETIRRLLGGLGERRLYSRQEANELTGEAKMLQQAVEPTVEALRAQSEILRANADITIAQLQNVSDSARATTDVAVAVADTVEVVAEESRRYAAAQERVRAVADSVAPAYAALLQGNSPQVTTQQLSGENQKRSGFLQLPHRR